MSEQTLDTLGLHPSILAGGAEANAFLDSMRLVQDDPADRLAAAVFEAPDAMAAAAQIRTLIQQHTFYTPDGQPSPQLPDVVKQYLRDTSALPPWVDPALVKTGEDLFILYGLSSVVILACASLPECYVMRRGVHVLRRTGYLTTDPTRRVAETAQMVMDVMSPGGLIAKSGGVTTGVLSAQKVRLVHAAIRYLLNHGRVAGLTWDSAWGAPICQEDLAFTLMTFSFVGVRSMLKLGVQLSDRQKDAYIHCWNVIGHQMGILPGLLPADFAQATVLFDRIKARQTGPNEDGEALMASLLNDLLIPTVSKIFPVGGATLPQGIVRKLIGKETADDLGVPGASAMIKAEEKVAIDVWRQAAWRRKYLYMIPGLKQITLWWKVRLLRKMGGIQSEFAITLANAIWAFPQVADVGDAE